ncbi:MAG: hypothetical protein IKX20_01110 [Paludibacteraceae bacterium]|nr:hypothetical protein [Paludibacteraceae bacterium]
MRKIFFLCVLCASVLTANATEGALNGKFTINAEGDQIVFSKGNLQYVGTWQFATNQWDCIGDEAQADDNRDLFGWGTGDAPNKVSTICEDYATFHDWGANPITNGGNTANAWRTLTKEEWRYLFESRTNSTDFFGVGIIGTMHGAILLPDNWTLPDGAAFVSVSAKGYELQTEYDGYYTINGSSWTDNEYTIEQWAVMEEAGAVFLPAAGDINISSGFERLGVMGGYWSATTFDEWHAYGFLFFIDEIYPTANDFIINNGYSVRLVQAAPEDATGIGTPSLQGKMGEASKVIRDGQLLIIRDGKTFNALGAEVQ